MDENMTNQVEKSESDETGVTDSGSITEVDKKTEMTKKKSLTKLIAIIASAIVVIVAVIITICLTNSNDSAKDSANDGVNDSTNDDTNDGGASAEEIREVELSFAKGAYWKLNSTSKTCYDLIKGIYDAWYFAIYESDDCLEHNRGWELSYKLNFEYSEIEDAMAKLGVPVTAYYIFEDFNYTVRIVQLVYESRGVYTQIDEDMNYVKTMLKKISAENYEYTEHEDLTLYYSEVLSCLEFIKSPSGSLTQLQNRITSYQTNINTYKNILGIAFDS